MVIFDRQKQKAVTDEASSVTAFLLYNALRMLQKDITARENMMLTGSKAAEICPEKSKRFYFFCYQ